MFLLLRGSGAIERVEPVFVADDDVGETVHGSQEFVELVALSLGHLG